MKNSNYRIFTTSDGSPTLFLTNESGVEEAMHSYHGALSETDYIYGEAIRRAFSMSQRVCVVSVGMGLGYVEMMTAALSLNWGGELQLVSFERQGDLRQAFLDWIGSELEREPAGLGENSSFWFSLYDDIEKQMSELFAISPREIRQRLGIWHERHQWRVHGALQEDWQEFPEEAQVILYDAFSKKASPDLWEVELLEAILARAGESCVFSTYSANSVLKRSLQANGFELENRSGFAGKRESTLAVKGRDDR